MPPNIEPTGPLYEDDGFKACKEVEKQHQADDTMLKLAWFHIIKYVYIHAAAIYALYAAVTQGLKWQTILFVFINAEIGGIGITAGSHRLWAHKSYKAKLPLKILLVFYQTMGFQLSVISWVRIHRMHHKYSDTDADPHNISRGMFFAHIGWLLCQEHPEVKAKQQTVDWSDMTSDPILRFQHKYFHLLTTSLFVLRAMIPVYLWGEDFWTSWNAIVFTLALGSHIAFLVNSLAHKVGNRPYDKHIKPSEHKLVSVLTNGEGWHNYHHAFPWDYKAAELGHYSTNMTKAFIDFMARIGWAYDLRTASDKVVEMRSNRTGDGSWEKRDCKNS